MIHKERKIEGNSSLDSEDRQLNGKRGETICPSLRSNRTSAFELPKASPAPSSEPLPMPAVSKPTAVNLRTFSKHNSLKRSEAKHRVI